LGIGLVAGRAVVAVVPTSLDFGQVTVGQSKRLDLTVFNAGARDLEIDEATVRGMGFSAPPLEGRITPGARKTVTVTFMPTVAGMFRGTLTISSNDPRGEVRVPLSGAGTQ
jgi:hypothetical protein